MPIDRLDIPTMASDGTLFKGLAKVPNFDGPIIGARGKLGVIRGESRLISKRQLDIIHYVTCRMGSL